MIIIGKIFFFDMECPRREVCDDVIVKLRHKSVGMGSSKQTGLIKNVGFFLLFAEGGGRWHENSELDLMDRKIGAT